MDKPTNFAFLVMASLPPLFSLFLYFVVTETEIRIDPIQVRWFTVGLTFWMMASMLKSLFVLLVLPKRGAYFAGYVVFVTLCVGLPIGFAAVYSAFQRTGECIMHFQEAHDAIHFSYTTFTTLGYGDMSPVGRCRIFTAVESILGYVSLGLGIAILFGIFQDKNRAAEEERYKMLENQMLAKYESLLKEVKATHGSQAPDSQNAQL